jgi:hypothetical protein
LKLSNEIFCLIFCKARRPEKCLIKKNICCALCDVYDDCVKQDQKIKPCKKDEDADKCDQLV